jgi:hypothetical protein
MDPRVAHRACRGSDPWRKRPLQHCAHALGGEQEHHPSSRSEVPLNDIAETGGSASRALRKVVSLRREESKMGEVFFVPSCYAPKASNVRHVEPSREETRRALSRTHEHEIQRRDLAASPFSHHPTIEKECFS